MADCYVALLREMYPQGPYFLAGHSFGGWAAFTMAQRLAARGHAIGRLAMVDAYAPDVLFALVGALAPDDTSLTLDLGKVLGLVAHQEMALCRKAPVRPLG